VNQLFPKYRQAVLSSSTGDWLTTSIKAAALTQVMPDTEINLATHEFVSDLPQANLLPVRSAALSNKSISIYGVAGSNSIEFTSLVSGSNKVRAIVLYEDLGADSVSKLIAYMDVGTGMPFTAVGGVTTIAPDTPWGGGFTGFFRV